MIEATIYYPDKSSETFKVGENGVRRISVHHDGTLLIQDGSTHFIEFRGLPFSTHTDTTV